MTDSPVTMFGILHNSSLNKRRAISERILEIWRFMSHQSESDVFDEDV